MKTSLFYQDGRPQIVFTPENDTEKRFLDAIFPHEPDATMRFDMYRGGFFECRGGWIRGNSDQDQDSVIFRLHQTDEKLPNAEKTENTPNL